MFAKWQERSTVSAVASHGPADGDFPRKRRFFRSNATIHSFSQSALLSTGSRPSSRQRVSVVSYFTG